MTRTRSEKKADSASADADPSAKRQPPSASASASASAVQISRSTSSQARRRRGHITLFEAWCKGCGICIEFCPQGVFEANGQGRPVVAYPEKCTACHWCDTHCPDMAIAVRHLDSDEFEELQERQALAERTALPAGGDQ